MEQVPVVEFIRVGVESGMRQLLGFGLFHPGNVLTTYWSEST